MITIVLLHKEEIGVIKELLGREVAVIEGYLGQKQLVALTEEEFPEKHELLSCEIDV